MDVVNNRGENSNEGQNSKVEDVSTKKEETNADTPKKDAVPLIKNEAKSKLTLADLLEVFDGVMEMKVSTYHGNKYFSIVFPNRHKIDSSRVV